MSLIHWWPLNGDTQDKIGNNNLRYINNSGKIVTNTSGKLGECYERTATGSSDLLRSTSKMKIFSEMSICAWVYLSEHANLSTANGIITSHDHTTNSGLGIGMYTTDGNNCYVSINAGNGSSRIHSSYWGTTNIKDGWHHICLAYGNDKKIHMYVDGKEDRAAVSYTIYFKQDYLDIFNWSTGYYNDSSYRPICKVCDARVYDHALSQAEVKELSKALVVHYTFDDILAESTTNVSTVSGWSPYTPYFVISERTETGLKLYRPSSSTSDVLALNNSAVTNKMTAGDIWTFSCYLYVDGKPYKCTKSDMSTYNYSGISYYSNDDGYYTCTFKVGAPDTWVIHTSMFGAVGTNVICEIDKIQFEKKDHATPYTPSSRGSMLANESGSIQPTYNTNINLIQDSSIGVFSLSCTGSTIINTPIAGDITSGATISCWIKTPTYPSENAIVFADYNSKLAFGFYNTQSAIIACGGYSSPYVSNIKSSWVDGWNHVVVTRDSGGTISCYLNGGKLTTSNTNNWSSSTGYSTIGGRHNGSYATYFTGYVDDYRVYHTLLSEADIQELYKTKAYVTDQGDIMSGKFVEDKAEAMVTNKRTFECNEVYEEIIADYERLAYIKSTGTQYIDTGISLGTNMMFDTLVSDVSDNAYIITQGNYGLRYLWSTFVNFVSGRRFRGTITGVAGEIYQIKGSNDFISINGINGNQESDNDNPSGNVIICRQGSCTMYKCALYNNNVLVRNFIPCRRTSDQAIGLYDTVNQTFYASAGSGSFIAGPVMTNTYASIYEDRHISGREIIEI